jgi:lipopolysaccharide biosynthesis protein
MLTKLYSDHRTRQELASPTPPCRKNGALKMEQVINILEEALDLISDDTIFDAGLGASNALQTTRPERSTR